MFKIINQKKNFFSIIKCVAKQFNFKSIVFSEAVRLRRLNETLSDYLASLERLNQKCIHSQFNIKLVSRILDLASKWNDRVGSKQDSGQRKTKARIIWASSFVNLLKLNSTEKFLVPDAAVVYTKPPTLLNMLTNYRNIAHNESFQRDVRACLSHPATNVHYVEIFETAMANLLVGLDIEHFGTTTTTLKNNTTIEHPY